MNDLLNQLERHRLRPANPEPDLRRRVLAACPEEDRNILRWGTFKLEWTLAMAILLLFLLVDLVAWTPTLNAGGAPPGSPLMWSGSSVVGPPRMAFTTPESRLAAWERIRQLEEEMEEEVPPC